MEGIEKVGLANYLGETLGMRRGGVGDLPLLQSTSATMCGGTPLARVGVVGAVGGWGIQHRRLQS